MLMITVNKNKNSSSKSNCKKNIENKTIITINTTINIYKNNDENISTIIDIDCAINIQSQ